MKPIRVVLADDHALVRSGLSMLLNAQPGVDVVGEAADATQVLTTLRECKPDVLILDYSMPGLSGVQLIERLHQDFPDTRVLVLTMHDDPAFMRAVLAAGGAGYLVKTAPEVELVTAIRAVSQGRLFVDLSLPLSNPSHQDNTSMIANPELSGGLSGLSERELQVFELLAQGYTNQQIADKLFVSVKTVETYRTRIGTKLGIHTRVDLIRFAVEAGILQQAHSEVGKTKPCPPMSMDGESEQLGARGA